MSANFLVNHWKKELQVFQENFNKLVKNSNPDAIHDLRVAVKKLRSYYKFYSEIFEEKSSLLFEGTEKLFSVLGKQRNVEVCFELLEQLNYSEKLSGFHHHLKIFLTETELRSKHELKSYNVNELNELTLEIEQTISVQEQETVLEKAHNLLKSSIDEVHHHLHKFDESFHVVRKKLKDVFYWSKMLPVQFYFSTKQVKLLDNALDCLGSAQDYQELRRLTKQYRLNFVVEGNEFELLKTLEKITKDNKNKVLQEAHRIIKELVKVTLD